MFAGNKVFRPGTVKVAHKTAYGTFAVLPLRVYGNVFPYKHGGRAFFDFGAVKPVERRYIVLRKSADYRGMFADSRGERFVIDLFDFVRFQFFTHFQGKVVYVGNFDISAAAEACSLFQFVVVFGFLTDVDDSDGNAVVVITFYGFEITLYLVAVAVYAVLRIVGRIAVGNYNDMAFFHHGYGVKQSARFIYG